MPLGFLNPALLFGGLAAAMPVIIHFLSRKKVQKQKFSDLRFLDEVQARQARSLGLRRWLLLLLRVLAILAIVMAVSGPRWGGVASGNSGARSLIFVIDTSASMSTQQESGTRLEDAINSCSHMLRALPADASVQVITAGSRTNSLFGQWLPAATGVISQLSSIRPTHGSLDFPAVIREATRLVARAPTQPVDLVIISDFQENPLQPNTSHGLQAAADRLLETGLVRIITHQVGQATAGGGIHDVILPRRAMLQGENVDLTAIVTSNLADQVFSLEIDGKPIAEAVLEVPSQTPVPLVFSFTVPAAGLHTGYVRKSSDSFVQDDERPFVMAVPNELSVLLVHGPDRPVDPLAGRGGWRYLAEALAAGEEVGVFRVKTMSSNDLASGDLAASSVVAFVDPEPLGRRISEKLRLWLNSGGRAVFLVGEPTLANYLDSSLLPLLGLTAGTQAVSSRPGQFQRPRVLDAGHPVFAGLGPEAIATFEDITWQRWLKIPVQEKSVLLELSDQSPLFISGNLEDGKFVFLPFNLLTASGKIASSPMALPFFQRLISWLATGGLESSAVNALVGQQAVVTPWGGTSPEALRNSANLMIIDHNGHSGQNANLTWQGNAPRLSGSIMDRSGFMVFVSDRDTLGLVAGQIPSTESVIGLWRPADWARQLQLFGLPVSGHLENGKGDDLVSTLNGRNLAPWFFGLAFLLLLAELYLGRGTASKAVN